MSNRRRYTRVPGPFSGQRLGFRDTPIQIFDLSEGGGFVVALDPPPGPGRQIVLRIDLPDDAPVCLKAEALYAKAAYGYAVSFVDVPADAAERLTRALLRARGLLPESERHRTVMLPACPRCRGSLVTPLGMAGSTLPWFVCDTCSCTWADRGTPAGGMQPPEDARALAPPQPGEKHVLVADDEPGVLRFVVKALAGYRVFAARNVAEAWSVGRSQPLDLLVTDFLMPDGTADELIGRLRSAHPALRVLVLTGHAAVLDAEGISCWQQERHLAKPCEIADLLAAVADLIGPPHAPAASASA